MGQNQIKNIKDDTFMQLKTLKSLLLDGNSIENLRTDTFKGLTMLEVLDLTNNTIKDFAAEVVPFSELKNLKILWLYGNKLTVINKFTFFGLSNLEELNLKYNPIKSFTDFSFQSLKNLKKLDLVGSICINQNFDLTTTSFADAEKCLVDLCSA